MSQPTDEKSYQVYLSGENRSTSELKSKSHLCEQCIVFIDCMMNKFESFTAYDGDVGKLRGSAISGCHMCEMILDRCHHNQDEFYIEKIREVAGALHMVVRDFRDSRKYLSFMMQHAGLDEVERASLHDTDGTGSMWHNQLARNWLSTCQHWHYECNNQFRSTVNPSRLLEIISSIDTTSLRLKSIDQNTAIPLGYCTLSHCWGGEQPVQLTRESLAAFQTCIPFDILPKTFADAIRITLNLGISYLWIDSLCICQDDEEDWLAESAKMGEIYRNGVCNIAALAAKNDHEGCFSNGPTAASKALYFSTRGKHYMTSKLGAYETRTDGLKDTPLGKRGWVFQELVLSPRTIFYGAECVSWACIEKEADEVRAMESHLPDHQSIQSYKFTFTSLHFGLSMYKRDWHYIVSEYTSTSLTYDSDKWLAISGLASRYTERSGSRLVAGLHYADILGEMTWWSKTPAGRVSNRAPTWSWLSCRSEVGMYAASSGKLLASLVTLPDASISSCTWHKISDDSESTYPSSRIPRYPITISGHIRPFRYVAQDGRFHESFAVEFPPYSLEAETERVWLDIPVADGTTIWGVLHSYRLPWDPSLNMIVLIPAAPGGYWQRVGTCCVLAHGFGKLDNPSQRRDFLEAYGPCKELTII